MDQYISGERVQSIIDVILVNLIEFAPKIIFAIIAFWVLLKAIKWGIDKIEKDIVARNAKLHELPGETEKRIRTVFGVVRKTVIIVAWGVAGLVLLSLVGVDVGPIIAAFGILGLAFSFGAQTLVKDFIGGIFILFENQIRVGDVANVNGTGGLVEEINLRTTVLRDPAGTLHVIPNGSISKLSNLTKDWSAAVLDIGVAYKEDTDKVVEVLKQVAADLRKDEKFKDMITADAEILGVDSFGDSAVVIKMRMKTLPIQQWAIGRELRRRIKYAFDEAGIEIPFPHTSVYFGEMSKPFKMEQLKAE